jgi:Cdc6-like AAA superfamily ATPase
MEHYQKIYTGDKYGSPEHSYVQKINSLFFEICSRHKIPPRIPAKIFSNFIDQNDFVVVILDQMDYLLKARGQRSSYGFAAHSLSQLKEPIEHLKDELTSLSGIGVVTKKLIEEILQSGTCSYYEKLLVS